MNFSHLLQNRIGRQFVCAAGITAIALGLSPQHAHAEQTYTSTDAKLTFSYPKSWKADDAGDRVRLTASDGSHYFVIRDTLSSLPDSGLASSPDVKTKAAEIVKPLLRDAELLSAQPVSMDHGQGAVYRFQSRIASEKGSPTAVYIAVIGSHSIVVVPEKAAQTGQSIGLSSVMQSLAFSDALPKPIQSRRQAMAAAGAGAQSSAPIGPATIVYATQIAPIFKDKCEVCHRSTSPLGGFSVTSYADVMKGGKHGALILAGNPGSSLLMDYLTGKRDLMPKGGPALPTEQIALIRKWISEGGGETPGVRSGGTRAAGSPAVAPSDPMMDTATAASARRARRAANLANRTASAAGAGSALLEVYSGHLAKIDTSFTLRLMKDNTASAVWAYGEGKETRYAGTYTGEFGNYFVTLKQSSEGVNTEGRTLTLNLQAKGSDETGLYGLDGRPVRNEIATLELTETSANTRGGGKGGAAKGGTGANSRSAQFPAQIRVPASSRRQK